MRSFNVDDVVLVQPSESCVCYPDALRRRFVGVVGYVHAILSEDSVEYWFAGLSLDRWRGHRYSVLIPSDSPGEFIQGMFSEQDLLPFEVAESVYEVVSGGAPSLSGG